MICRLVIIILLLQSTPCFALDSLIIERNDTVHIKGFHPKKVVVYKYNKVSFLLNFYKVRQHTISLTQSDYKSGTAEDILTRLDKEISLSDTAYLDQAYFLSINWIPFDDFLCSQLDKSSCLIRDSAGDIHQTYIAAPAVRKNAQYYGWGGVLYFLPGQTKWFIEKLIWIH
jgi:hypothetical protein